MDFFLRRHVFQDAKEGVIAGIFGTLTSESEALGVTVEQEWAGNRPFLSCVPDGKYALVPFVSPRYGKTFVMVNPGLGVYALADDRLSDHDRYLCLFPHEGSYPSNFQGCIGLGASLYMDRDGGLCALQTLTTCDEFAEKYWGADTHTLTIYTQPGCL